MEDWFSNLVQEFIGPFDFARFGEPPKPVGEHETIVGELDETGKKLWCLREQAKGKEFDVDFQLHFDQQGGPEVIESEPIELTLSKLQSRAVSTLFWINIHSRFPCTIDTRVLTGIRAGWKVVTYPAPSS
ncbi:MAG: hypothetical protein G01um101431_284 [Parcubacteria group bacterium Gr01-1014_31]|nr:MAG: hypothetical protein G01um101431_284 [Parcubacteria group bacterium Gr01-1014_31]